MGIGCNGGKGTLGMDLAGVVVALGPGATRLSVGDQVWADIGGGSGDSGAMASRRPARRPAWSCGARRVGCCAVGQPFNNSRRKTAARPHATPPAPQSPFSVLFMN